MMRCWIPTIAALIALCQAQTTLPPINDTTTSPSTATTTQPLTTTTAGKPTTPPDFPTGCYPDILFILQTSDVIKKDQITQAANIIENMQSQLQIAYDKTNSLLYNLRSNVSSQQGKQIIDNFLSNANYGGRTDLKLALSLARNYVFTAGQDRRKNPNIVVLFADGEYDAQFGTFIDASNALRKVVPQLYVVQFGDNVNLNNLIDIVDRDLTDIYTINNTYSLMQKLATEIVANCPAVTTTNTPYPTVTTTTTAPSTTTGPATTTGPTPGKHCACMDLVLAIEASTAEDEFTFSLKKQLAMNLVSQMNISASAVRVGFVFYNANPYYSGKLGQYQDLPNLVNALFGATFNPLAGNQSMTNGLQAVYDMLSQVRGTVPRVVYFVSNGIHSATDNPVDVANSIRSKYSGDIISIGVPSKSGPPADLPLLRQIAGCTGATCPNLITTNDVYRIPSSDVVDPVLNITPCQLTSCS